MDAELASLELKLEQLISQHASQQARLMSHYADAAAENSRLKERVDALEAANRELTDKLGLVGSRLQARREGRPAGCRHLSRRKNA